MALPCTGKCSSSIRSSSTRNWSAAPNASPAPTSWRDDILFDDFLGLASRRLQSARLIVFAGESGSGKSTAIDFVLRNHFAGAEPLRVDGRPLVVPKVFDRSVVVLDEISRPSELAFVWRAMRSGRRVLVASHLDRPWFLPFALFGRIALFRTDRSAPKLLRYLSSKGIPASPAALEHYVMKFGATYTDVDVILERCPARTFDESLARFLRTSELRRG